MEIMLRTSDWLRTLPEGVQSGALPTDDRLGFIAVLAASLEQEHTLNTPRDSLVGHVRTELSQLPPQFSGFADKDPVGQWLQVAAVAEDLSASGLAHVIVTRLIELLTSVPTDTMPDMSAQRREHLGVCWARRGRLSRIAGRLDDAVACYQRAARLSARTPWRDALPQAHIGLALVAFGRGNLPEGERRARMLLRHRPRVFAMYRLQAHQMLAYATRRRGNLLEALLHGWEAFDLLDRDDFRRDELLVSMAEIAAEFGDLTAAANGFASVRVGQVRMRIRIPALAGALDVALRRFRMHPSAERRADLVSHLQALDQTRAESAAPSDRLIALLGVVEGAIALGDVPLATQRLDEAEHAAEQYGYFEKQFRVAALQAELRTLHADPRGRSVSRAATTNSIAGHAPSGAQVMERAARHPALQRLTRLHPLRPASVG